MPAELFTVALAGSVLLLWASLRSGIYRKKIALSMAAAERLLERVRMQIQGYNREQRFLPLSISFGQAVSASSEYPLAETLRVADKNMYADKQEQGEKVRREMFSSLFASLMKQGNLAAGEREQMQELTGRLDSALKQDTKRRANLELLALLYDLGIDL